MKKLSIILVCFLFLAACATSGNPKIRDQKSVANIQKGITTKQDLVEMFGQPQAKNKQKDGVEKWSYVYSEAKVKGATFIPIVGLFAGGATADVNTLEFEFDPNGVVSKYSVGEGNIDTQNFGKTKTNIETVEQ